MNQDLKQLIDQYPVLLTVHHRQKLLQNKIDRALRVIAYTEKHAISSNLHTVDWCHALDQ